MVTLKDTGVMLSKDGTLLNREIDFSFIKNTMTYEILREHNKNDNMKNLKLKFDALVSPDNNYVSILQTAISSGIREFPVPYILSNCHNTLCATGGTINEDDHIFGLDCVKKYGGLYIPPYKAVIHQFMREMVAGTKKMVLGSDSHTRYGPLGTLAIGEGGGELVKQLLSQTYDLALPPIIAVKLTGKINKGIGPQDVALSLIKATFKNNFTKNKILEFIGDGIKDLSVEFRMGIDVMTTESGALSSIWSTDDKVKEYMKSYGREVDFQYFTPMGDSYYDGLIEIDLSQIESMIALPYHPSNVITIKEFNNNPKKYMKEIEEIGNGIKNNKKDTFIIMDKVTNKGVRIDQGLVSGCSGGLFENISAIADILRGSKIYGDGPSLGINPASNAILSQMSLHGILSELICVGATIRPCICGPCFGVTDVPANNQLSIRHVTRNYPNREGAKPNEGQMAATMLMDARSIAATIKNHGIITPATDLDIEYKTYLYVENHNIYKNQIFNSYKSADENIMVRKGPNIEDWPNISHFKKHLILKIVGLYNDFITTDDLSPSGGAVSYRSNPTKLAEFTMINKDKEFLSRAKDLLEEVTEININQNIKDEELKINIKNICKELNCTLDDILIGGVVVSHKIGDGSSREQAASSQKILGIMANISEEFATKRYRSNLINWGIIPILSSEWHKIKEEDILLISYVDNIIESSEKDFQIKILNDPSRIITGNIGYLNEKEQSILKKGSLINYNKYRLVNKK